MRASATTLLALLLACGGDGVAPGTEQELHDRLVFEATGGIGVMAPDGSQRVVVPIGDLERARDADVSRDGRRIVFAGSRDGVLDLYVMNADGSARQQVTRDSAEDRNPTWTPDGTRLLFDRSEIDPRGRPVLMLMSADGSGRKQLRLDASVADWSPDGLRVAFTGSGTLQGVYVMDHDGSDLRSLADVCGAACEDDRDPRWSPDGGSLAFTRPLPGGAEAIGVMRSDGTDARLVLPSLDAAGPVWSPDGAKLAFTRVDGTPVVYIVELATSDTVALSGGVVTDWAP
jgi:Tol biopolymer transport system component